jgi:hypothetical protein
VVHYQVTGLACVVEVHDDEVVDLDSVRMVGLGAADARAVVLQEEIPVLAIEAEVLKRVEASREAQHLPDVVCTAQFTVEHRALEDDIVGEVVQPVWVVVQVWRLVVELGAGSFGVASKASFLGRIGFYGV